MVLVVKKLRSTQYNYLNCSYGSCRKIGQVNPRSLFELSRYYFSPNATYQISRQFVHWFQRRKVLNVFTMNRPGSYADHMTWTVFSQLKETLYVILLQFTQWLLRRCLNCHSMTVLGQMSNNALLFSHIFVYLLRQL